MNSKLLVGTLIAGVTVAVVRAQSTGPSADEIAQTIAIAQKTGNEPLTDAEKQYGLGLRLVDRQGPVVLSIQGPLNRIFTEARTAVAKRASYAAANVSQDAREPVITAMAMPNNTYQFWDARGPVQISEVVIKPYRAGNKDPQVIHPPRGCLFSPLEYKKRTGESYKAKLALCKFPLDILSSPAAKFELTVITDQGDWTRALTPDELKLVK